MTEERVIDKITKLLKLAERGDEHEAAVAAQRAAELMAKHQIDVAELRPVGEAARVEEGRVDDEPDAPMSRRCEMWHRALVVAVTEGLGGSSWRQAHGKAFMFFMVGPPDAVATARYLYMALEGEVSRRSRRRMADLGESNAWRRAYALGMVARVAARMRAGRTAVHAASSSTALVHVSAQERAVQIAIEAKGLKAGRGGGQKRPEAGGEGWRDGADLDLSDVERPGLGAGNKRLRGVD